MVTLTLRVLTLFFFSHKSKQLASCHSNTTHFSGSGVFSGSQQSGKIVYVRARDVKVWHGKQSSKKCWYISTLYMIYLWCGSLFAGAHGNKKLPVSRVRPAGCDLTNISSRLTFQQLFFFMCLFLYSLNITSFWF